ncbi:MAG: NADH-quinone oxidoreductase subunit C [Candidatus Binatia bacterium]|nr:MAG: NADH-quinone oxidoreductase subunit C [Candidatus Binatia bacterium]
MDAAAIHARLRERFGEAIEGVDLEAKDPFVVVRAEAIAEVCRYLRDDPDLRFDCLSNLTGVDLKAENLLQVVYHLYSYPHRHSIVLKVTTPRENPRVPTVERVWKAANWLEREAYDLLGIVFEGHSDLRRILMPEDWVGHPLRKDFVEPEEYHGISTRRESLLRS